MGAVHHYFDALPSEPMTTQQRVHITHEFKSDPQTVFNKLAEHENLGPVFGANVTRVSDGTSTRNGAARSAASRLVPFRRSRKPPQRPNRTRSSSTRSPKAVHYADTGAARSSRRLRAAAPRSTTRSGSTQRSPGSPSWLAKCSRPRSPRGSRNSPTDHA